VLKVILIGLSVSLTDLYLGLQIAQVCVVFHLPKLSIWEVCRSLDTEPATHLAYVEWFSPLTAIPDTSHLMYWVSRLVNNGKQHTGIIWVDWVLHSIHLLQCFGPFTPWAWNSFMVLDQCQTFYVNPFTNVHNYIGFV